MMDQSTLDALCKSFRDVGVQVKEKKKLVRSSSTQTSEMFITAADLTLQIHGIKRHSKEAPSKATKMMGAGVSAESVVLDSDNGSSIPSLDGSFESPDDDSDYNDVDSNLSETDDDSDDFIENEREIFQENRRRGTITLMLQNPRLYLGVCEHSMFILDLLSEEIKMGGNSKLKAKEVVCLILRKIRLAECFCHSWSRIRNF